jgi:transposase-like protein
MGQQKRKSEVVEEYLRGEVSLRELSRKYGINHRTIHRWVKIHQSSGGLEEKKVRSEAMSRMPDDVAKLQRELYESRLHVKLLETMIGIAEEEMGIPIRKKSGAKQ